MRVASGLGKAMAATAAALLLSVAPARADGPGLGTYVPEDAPRDYEPGIDAHDFYGLLDSALHKNFVSLIMVFGGCFAGDFANQLGSSEVGKAGKPVAVMTATGRGKGQVYEQTPGTVIGNPFIEGVNEGWVSATGGQFTEPESQAFAQGEHAVDRSIKDWNNGLPPDEKTKKALKDTHPANVFVNGGDGLTLPQKDGAKRYAIIFVGEPETVQDWRDYSNVFITLNDAGYEIQGFFGSGKRSETDHTALLPNGHSILENARPEIQKDPKTGRTYGGQLGNVVTNYWTDVTHREKGVTTVRHEEVTIPFEAATTANLEAAMAKWRDASGKSCAVFYFTAFGHFLPVLKDRATPLKVAGDTAPDCDRHASYRRGGGPEYATVNQPGTALEIAVLAQINYVRTHPQDYADALRREPQTAATREAVAFLERQAPLAALDPDAALTTAAERHAADIGPRGIVGHIGSDGTNATQRMQQAGVYATIFAEEVSLGQATASGVVRQLVLDEGAPGAPHRADLFDGLLKFGGVGCGVHARFRQVCVVDLTAAMMRR
ncbi:MAG: CAP domain-containing protein [Proteobacteria bacterium]|nr:CAP domain-containing protein [Pseudomonadota bacterium]